LQFIIFSSSRKSDLSLCLGTSLQILPCANLPLCAKRNGGKFVTVNLQITKHEKKANLKIHEKVDKVMIEVCRRLDIEIPTFEKPVVLLESLHTEKSEAKLNVVIRDELLSMKKEDFIKIEQIKTEDFRKSEQIQMEYVLNSEQIKTDEEKRQTCEDNIAENNVFTGIKLEDSIKVESLVNKDYLTDERSNTHSTCENVDTGVYNVVNDNIRKSTECEVKPMVSQNVSDISGSCISGIGVVDNYVVPAKIKKV
jgi:hypothetical protein